MNQSLAGVIKEIAQSTTKEITACVVAKSSPLQLKFQNDSKLTLGVNDLVIPGHIKGLAKGKTVYVQQIGRGGKYLVVGRG